MRVLSFSQPWLWAIFDPIANKRVENRSWPPPVHEIGEVFAMHAAKSWDHSAFGYFLELGIDHFPGRYDAYPSGIIQGTARIAYVRTERERFPEAQRRWFFGPFGWFLEDVCELPRPIQHKGAQGFRHLPDDITYDIKAQAWQPR